MPENEDSVDGVLAELGLRKFHFINFSVILLVTAVTSSATMSYVFTARDTQYRCAVPECETNPRHYDQTWLSEALPIEDGKPHKCKRYSSTNQKCDVTSFLNTSAIPCDEWIYGEGDTIVKGFDIPCQDWKRTLVGTINSAGQLVSLLFSGILSDKYGRRKVMLIMVATSGVFGLIQSFSPNYTFFLVFEFLNLAASSGGYAALFVYSVEILRPHQRMLGSAIIDISYAVGGLLLGLYAWATPSWRWLLRVTSLPTFLALLSFFIIPESFRWLNAKGRKDECINVLTNAAELNKITFSDKSVTTIEKMRIDDIDNRGQSNDSTIDSSFLTIIKVPRLLFRLLNCAFCWFSAVLVFYGLTFNSVNVTGGEENVYLDYTYVTLMDIPAVIIYVFVSSYVGRKKTMFCTLFSSGVLCIVYAVVPSVAGTAALILYLLSKLFISIALSMTYVVTSELFPTNLRNTSMNFCSVIARIGGALAPQVVLLSKVHRSLPMIVYGGFPLVAALLILALPETRNRKLPDTIDESILMQ